MSLRGRSVLITSGPTREFLDPVRFLTNASSGAMGFALAAAAREAGAKVTVISGPTNLEPPPGIRVIPVITALEMRRETLRRSRAAAIIIGAAAVSDWRVARTAVHKIKRNNSSLRLTLIPNPDIIKDAAAKRRPGQLFVGFALETRRATEHARGKLARKGLDLVVANGPASLASGRIAATLVAKGWTRRLPPGPKARVAKIVVAEITRLLNEHRA
ncbi:MAG: phosphopantothenoylcysteine decarboxylase [Elusimicrobia bacterium]|nr:phosphopantothenoylcysteine decarboxylase [Elusimicrobiota bacterium]